MAAEAIRVQSTRQVQEASLTESDLWYMERGPAGSTIRRHCTVHKRDGHGRQQHSTLRAHRGVDGLLLHPSSDARFDLQQVVYSTSANLNELLPHNSLKRFKIVNRKLKSCA